MAAYPVKRAESPEAAIDDALQKVPASEPVFEIVTLSPGRIAKTLQAFGLDMKAPELQDKLRGVGFVWQGTEAALQRLKPQPTFLIAEELSAALADSEPLFWVHTEAGPVISGSLDSDSMRAAGLTAEGTLLNVGSAEAIAGLCSAVISAWVKGPGRRLCSGRAWMVSGGSQDGSFGRYWQAALQILSDETQTTLHVRHLPTSGIRWARPLELLTTIRTVGPGGRTLVTRIERVRTRRGPASKPVFVDVGAARSALGRLSVQAEGRPSARRYRVSPRQT